MLVLARMITFSEMVSHILEAIVKRRPGGMEVTSTGDFISKINDINSQEIKIEDIGLKQIDDHLDREKKEAQERYENFDRNGSGSGVQGGAGQDKGSKMTEVVELRT